MTMETAGAGLDTAVPGDDEISLTYTGTAKPLFWLMIKTLALTIITLGIYRFWMKVRTRRYFWSHIRLGGEPLQFTGTGLEIFLGFLVAVVFLAIYLAIFNFGLMFVGLSFFQGHPAAQSLSIFAVLPLIYYAQFRARRYLAFRTRWRGIRFAMGEGAVTYAFRALLMILLVIVTLGLAVPYMTFKLAKFATDRTWFGDLKFEQHGSWTKLFGYWIAAWGIILGAAAILGGAFYFFLFLPQMSGEFVNPDDVVVPIVVSAIAFYALFLFSVVWYQTNVFRYMTSNQTIGGAQLTSAARTGGVIKIYFLGILGMIAVSAAIGGVFYIVAMPIGLTDPAMMAGAAMPIVAIVVFALLYLLAILVFGALAAILISQPLLRYFIETTTITGKSVLEAATQRAGEDSLQAEGFADALDVGVAF